MSALQKQINDA